ncbi:MAG: choice-of-anchor A family protein [Gammaproteobacteria bacterium]
MRRLLLATAVLSLFTGSAHAGVLDLASRMGNANIFTLHDFNATSSDVEGAVVAGGSVNVSGYSINANNQDAFGKAGVGNDGYAVVARGDVTLKNGSINNGLTYAGGKTSVSSASIAGISATEPIDFDLTANYYKLLSTNLSQLAGTGSVSKLYSGVLVTGGGSGNVDIFNVASSMFATSSSWTLSKLTPGQTLIFNVSGALGTFNNGGISFQPLAGYNVLFNFFEAGSVDVRGVIGSVLAPNAAVTANWGVINGNVVVDTWASTVQINANHYFKPVEVAGLQVPTIKPPVADVPEPASTALALAGLAALGFTRRKRA